LFNKLYFEIIVYQCSCSSALYTVDFTKHGLHKRMAKDSERSYKVEATNVI